MININKKVSQTVTTKDCDSSKGFNYVQVNFDHFYKVNNLFGVAGSLANIGLSPNQTHEAKVNICHFKYTKFVITRKSP